ncbi:hypothetical protein [Micromonospora sp. NBC_00858]|uniref:hypothetical protein n=1 Tax=Micromonospora sp. NBC_00858 TaxID=2975979 RepID=UPI003870EE0B|nr:hypothetical protein OG990_04655 [Micromonospora sp. NBC_00858]
MTWLGRKWMPLSVLVAATAALVASVVWTAGSAAWRPTAGTMGPGLRGEGPVRNMVDADRAAGRFAERWGLHVGEVMQFDNGFYAELVDPAGNGATEVLIDPQSGAVQIELGPAMMWNTAYGMHPARGDRTATVGLDQARSIADQWLRDNRPGEHADQAEAFPGYYTLHTMRGDQVVSMLSVHATSGAVWYHSWHGRFLRMQEHPD